MKRTPHACLLALALTVASSSSFAVTIKIGTPAPEGSPWYLALRDIAEKWERISNGSIQVRIYPGGIAGNEPDLVRKMRIGQLHAAALSGQDGLSQIAEEMRIFETPMLIRSNQELDYVRAEIRADLEALMIARGFRVLAWTDIGWVYLFATRPVTTQEDARSLKIRVGPGDASWIKLLKDRGYHPVPLPMTEIHGGLQSGLIDGFTTPPAMALSTQWFGLAPHMMEFKWAPLTGSLIVSERAWQGLPADLRPALEAAAREAATGAQEEIRRFEEQALEAMKRYGLSVHPVSREIAAGWEREMVTSYETILGSSIPESLYGRVKECLAEFRATHGESEHVGGAESYTRVAE